MRIENSLFLNENSVLISVLHLEESVCKTIIMEARQGHCLPPTLPFLSGTQANLKKIIVNATFDP